MKRKHLYALAASLLIALAACLFAIFFFLSALDWEGPEGDLRAYNLPSYIRNVPRVEVVVDTVSYRSTFMDGGSPGLDCISYRSNATPEALRQVMESYLRALHFQPVPPPETVGGPGFTDYYNNGSSDVWVKLWAEKERTDVQVCHFYY